MLYWDKSAGRDYTTVVELDLPPFIIDFSCLNLNPPTKGEEDVVHTTP